MGLSYNGVFLFAFAFLEFFIVLVNMDMKHDFPAVKWFLRDKRDSALNSTVIDLDQRLLREHNYSLIRSRGAICNGTMNNDTTALLECHKEQTDKAHFSGKACCPEMTTTEKTTTTANSVPGVDILTAVSISVTCAVVVTVCLTLYCCCCQRKQQESNPSSVKMMWIGRSFGKQLDRNNHVVGAHRTLLASSSGNIQGSDEIDNDARNEDRLNLVKITITNPSNEHINADQ